MINYGGRMDALTTVFELMAEGIHKLLNKIDKAMNDIMPKARNEVKTGESKAVKTWL